MSVSLTRLLRLVCLLGVLAAPACRRPAPPAASAVVAPLPPVSGSLALSGIGDARARRARSVGRAAHLRARTSTICFSRRASCRRRTGCSRWISGAGPCRAGCRRCSGSTSSSATPRRAAFSTTATSRADWASYGPGVKAIAEAFVAGINAWVDEARVHVPEEFTLAGWLPERWSAGGSAEPDGCVRRRRRRRGRLSRSSGSGAR